MSGPKKVPERLAATGQHDSPAAVSGPPGPGSASPKVQPPHLERLAVVYVRQSTPHQVAEYRESRARQYALADYAAALGWPRERVLVIDEDQGHSGQCAEGRAGFQHLLAELTLDHVGMVLGLEMSRLARSNKDWHHLLEVCAIFGTLLADQEGIYDPREANDRLILGLKGTMSELEIQTMRNRLEKGRLNKALRGELLMEVPVGYVKAPSGGLALDPDEQARAVVGLVFDKFDELGSAGALFRYLLRHGIRLGVRARRGPQRGQLDWRPPRLQTIYKILHHPFYAGTYAYGRCALDPKRKRPGHRGTGRRWLPMDQWKVVLHDRVPAYITWEHYLRNQERLRQNRSRADASGVPRMGAALLGGLLFCGRCGTRMHACYSRSQLPRYECLHYKQHGLERTCRGAAAGAIDSLIAQQVLRALEPAALDLSLRACEDVERERARLALHWQQQLERARYECAKAERHYRAVDPDNRLVARTLEQQWEQALRQEQRLREEHDRFLRQTPPGLTPQERDRIRALAADIPALWAAAATTAADRKEIIRCLLDRVVASVEGNTEWVEVALHWAGGFVSRHRVRRPVRGYDQLRDGHRLVGRLRQLRRAGHTVAEIARRLDQEGFRPASGRAHFTRGSVRQLLLRWGLAGLREEEVLRAGEWRLPDLARELRVHPSKLRRWIQLGWVRSRHPRGVWSHIVWADAEELRRLGRLRDHAEAHRFAPYPAELTTPRRPASRRKQGRPAQP
jgi:DNA invertase Pin-like site-specific DNA recombinase